MKTTLRIFRPFYEGVAMKLWFLFQKMSTPCVSVYLKQIKRNFKEIKLFSRSSDILCLFGILLEFRSRFRMSQESILITQIWTDDI